MNKVLSARKLLADEGGLRRRAEERLRRKLSMENTSQSEDVGRQLYELRVNQIEIELLSEEFSRLRQKVPVYENASKTQGTSGCGYFFLDRDGRILDAKFSGISFPQVVQHKKSACSLIDCICQNDRLLFQNFLLGLCGEGGNDSCELVFDQAASKKRLGVVLPKYVSVKAIADANEQFILAVIEDIGEKKIAEEREKSGNAVRVMLDRAIAASRNEIYMFDTRALKFTFANQRALENLGYSMDEMKWLSPSDIQSHVFNQEMGDAIDYLLKHKTGIRKFNAVHLRKDGTLYPVEIYLQLFEHDTENSFIAIALDTSSQTAIESQLKSIVESAGAIIFAADINLNMVFMSDQISDLLGYSASLFVGHSLVELLEIGGFHESDMSTLLDGFNQVLKNGVKVSDVRCRARHTNGSWRWLSVNMTPSRSVDGMVCQLVGVMHDINAQKMAEDALLELNRKLDSRVQEEIQKNQEKDLLLQQQSRLAGMGEMIGNIAHQWRQPINSLGLILSDLEDAARYGECDFAYIHESVWKSKKIIQKMSCTIDDFRHFFRAKNNAGTFSLKQVTDECINLVEAAMKSNNIHIAVHADHDVVVCGYANEYSQALMNILSNARDAIVDRQCRDGEIVVEIGEEGEYGVHHVSDNGGGIAPEVLGRIFEPHFTTKDYGVGIGLYMSMVSIQKNMNGRIAVKNVENGAKFSIYVPKADTGDDHVSH